jgi:hypothetical protein
MRPKILAGVLLGVLSVGGLACAEDDEDEPLEEPVGESE